MRINIRILGNEEMKNRDFQYYFSVCQITTFGVCKPINNKKDLNYKCYLTGQNHSIV